MCHSFLCHQVVQWVQANPIGLAVGVLFAVVAFSRLARRGRWPVIVLTLVVWTIVACVMLLTG